jgi:hypothetical protein
MGWRIERRALHKWPFVTSNQNREGQVLADCVEKVGIQAGWDSAEACFIEVRSEVRCALRTFSGSLGHLRL